MISESWSRHIVISELLFTNSSNDHTILFPTTCFSYSCHLYSSFPLRTFNYSRRITNSDIISSTLTLTTCVCSFLKRSLHSYYKCYTILDAHIPSSSFILWSRNYILISQAINHIISFLLCHNYSSRGHAIVLWSRQFLMIPQTITSQSLLYSVTMIPYYNLATIFYYYDLGRVCNSFPFASVGNSYTFLISSFNYDLGYVSFLSWVLNYDLGILLISSNDHSSQTIFSHLNYYNPPSYYQRGYYCFSININDVRMFIP